MKTKRIRKPVESPRNPFDAAKLMAQAAKNLYGGDRERAFRWAIEAVYQDYPVNIIRGRATP